MSEYKYKMLQIPANIIVQRENYSGEEAAKYLQKITNEQAKQGWEFYRMDTFIVSVQPGCLGFLLGQRQTNFNNYVVTFRGTDASIMITNENSEVESLPSIVLNGIINVENSKVHNQPGLKRSSGLLKKGETVSIYGRNIDSRWVQIYSDGSGWVLTEDIHIKGDIGDLATTSNRQ